MSRNDKPIRKSQAITPFGPGAIVDFPGPVSLIHVGIDAYPVTDPPEFMITDEKRLSDRLNVDYFIEPVEYRSRNHGLKRDNEGLTIPFLRFPLWHQCPRCGRLKKSKYHKREAPICEGPIGSGKNKGKSHSKRKCIQVRFVTACEHGHISDFPWREWIVDEGQLPFSETENRWLRMRASGSASAAGISVVAEEYDGKNIKIIHGPKPLGLVFGGPSYDEENDESTKSPLGRRGITCNGENPVLGVGTVNKPVTGCGQQLWLLLKNASNLYYPDVKSSIFIPYIEDSNVSTAVLNMINNEKFRDQLFRTMRGNDDGLLTKKQAEVAIEEYYNEHLNDQNVREVQNSANTTWLKDFLYIDRNVRLFLNECSKLDPLKLEDYQEACKMLKWDVNPKLLLDKTQNNRETTTCNADLSSQFQKEAFEDDQYRLAEYNILTRDTLAGVSKNDLDVTAHDMSNYPQWLSSKFNRISQLNKLRETRAFTGFSRIFSHKLTSREKRSLFTTKSDWLPAVIVRGEGIFFDFSKKRLDDWYENNRQLLEQRESQLNQGLADYTRLDVDGLPKVSAKKVLIHTFAHVLINQLVYSCGYGSASLKERLYCSLSTEPEMNAVMIYTAAGDAEGSMGGLVRQALPDRLPKLIENAILRASWCTSDPVCIESTGQGPSGMNLAACHSCALLPETSCEESNLLLDRGMLVGTIDHPEMGFFSDLIMR